MTAAPTAPSTTVGGAAPPTLRAALAYAQHGWLVLPLHTPVDAGCSCDRECPSAGKHPRIPWKAGGTTDADRVLQWWRQWPDAGVGVVTGAVSGLLVLDVDGASGIDSVQRLQRVHGPLPDTGWVRTGSGGWHLYLQHPGVKLSNTARRLGAGLDTRGDGGMVVTPPSRHASGHHYEWVTDPTPQLVPGWLLALLRAPRRRLPTRAFTPRPPQPRDALAPLVWFAANAPAGQRNGALFWAACRAGEHVARGEATRDDAEQRLLEAAHASGHAAKDGEAQALATIRSGLDKGGGA